MTIFQKIFHTKKLPCIQLSVTLPWNISQIILQDARAINVGIENLVD
jgi:hypothetical protein